MPNISPKSSCTKDATRKEKSRTGYKAELDFLSQITAFSQEKSVKVRQGFKLESQAKASDLSLKSISSQFSTVNIRQFEHSRDLNAFELANVRIFESCHQNSSRPSEWKKNTKKCLIAFFKLKGEHGQLLKGIQ